MPAILEGFMRKLTTVGLLVSALALASACPACGETRPLKYRSACPCPRHV